MTTILRRQESEVEQELRLAFEEACLDAGITLSSTISPMAWWLLDDDNDSPVMGELAGWLSLARRRSYQPSIHNKYHKYTLPLTVGEQPQEELTEALEEDLQGSEYQQDQKVHDPLPQEISLKERLKNATELDVMSKISWSNLASVHRTEHTLDSDETSEDNINAVGITEVTVNSGGVVYFALFQNSHMGDAKQKPEESENASEAAAVFKFASSRLATQSECLGFELARHLGVGTPQARVIHRNMEEWKQMREAIERIKAVAVAEENEMGMQTCEELLETFRLSHCMLIMGYIHGHPLAESQQAFTPQEVAMKTASALGRILVLDLVIRNEDRLVCQELGWRGNPGNLLVSDRCPLGFNKMSPQKMLSKTSSVQRRSELHCHKKSESFHKLASQSTSDLQQLASSELGLLQSTKSLSIQCVIVAIDSGIPRRPPALKAQNDQRDYPKVVELLINDEKIAAELLKEISWENLGVESPKTGQGTDKSDKLDQLHSAKQIDHIKVVKAFQAGFTAGIRDMQILQMFLLKLFRQLDHLLKDFAVYMSAQSKSHEDGNKRLGSKPGSPQPQSQGVSVEGSPSTENTQVVSQRLLSSSQKPAPISVSPVTSTIMESPSTSSPSRQSWHKKGSPGRLTLKLKNVSKTAKVDDEVNRELKLWDEKLHEEGHRICKEHGFTTGFLEGGGAHSLVDSYELKVRLEHVLERMKLISSSADTEKPSCVLPHLFIGGALAARSVHTLQHLGITHILCLCPSELFSTNVGDFPDLFKYQHYAIKDVDEEDIAVFFEGACKFVDMVDEEGGKVLVHCFEGKSRSATIVLAYLMLCKGYTLAQAWTTLRTVHQRSQPNDSFMKALVELDEKLHGKASMSVSRRRPVVQKCPVCGKPGGFSISSLQQHFHRAHPGTQLHTKVSIPPLL
ncbi:unnamed protein product [Sphagnum jensenii]|uniref:Dual specificity protein phosphatase PHS1 n=1 Tax=Sphagnum jensenii TaxID=128206 RepID=A0ABP0XHZ8_9BRYO